MEFFSDSENKIISKPIIQKNIQNQIFKKHNECYNNKIQNVLEKILECKVDKKINLDSFPITSNISNILNCENLDEIFFISKKKNEKFGISLQKINNDYYHIGPIHWKQISNGDKKANINYKIKNENKIINFKETDSNKELNRINQLFSENII
jgi:hypothetical protein